VINWPFPIPGPAPRWPVPVPQPGPGSGSNEVPVPALPDATGQVVVGAVGTTGAAPAPSGGPTVAAGPAQVGDWKQFLIWIAALAALWLILTAAQDAGYPEFANGMAGLILLGAILAMGPHAIANAKLIFK